jgi:hypothetical protein
MEVAFGKTESVPAAAVVAEGAEKAATPTAASPAAPAAAAPTPAPEASVPAASVPAASVPAAPEQKAVGFFGKGAPMLGDKIPDFSEIVLPRINIVQNIGKLSESFPKGAILFNQALVIFTPPEMDARTNTIKTPATPPVTMIALGFRETRYCEKVEGGGESGARGIIVSTEAEVRANGGTLDYAEYTLKKGSGMKRFEPMADALVAIQRPEFCADDDSTFTYEVEGVKYAIALWAMRGTAYTAAAKRVFFTARKMGCLKKGGYPSWQFAISTRLEKYPGGHSAWVPVAIQDKVTTPKFLEFAAQVLESPTSDAGGEAAAA